MTINISLTDNYHNKKALVPRKKGNDYSFTSTEISVANFIKHVLSGKSWAVATYKDNHRAKDAFVQSSILALDLDSKPVNHPKGVSVPDCLQNAAIAQWAALIHPTPTSSPTHHKTRVVFVLEKSIDDGEKWELAQRACLHHFDDLQPDPSCKNRSRQYHGHDRGDAHERPEIVLPIDVVWGWVIAYQEHERKEAEQLKVSPVMPDNASDSNRARYAEKAFGNILNDLESATEGNRNTMLNKAAFKLFSMARGGWPGITDARIELSLTNSGVAIGLEKHAVESTIKSAKRAAPVKPLVLTDKYAPLAEFNLEDAEAIGATYQQATMNTLQFTLQQFLAQSKAGQLSTDEMKTMAEKVQTVVDNALTMTGHIESVSGIDASRRAAALVKTQMDNPSWILGLRSGLKQLDYSIGGFPGGQCYTFLGATGTGKTTLMATIAASFASQAPIMIVSCESKPEVFIMRMWAYFSQIPFGSIRRGANLVKAENEDGQMVVTGATPFTAEQKKRLRSAQGRVIDIMNSGTVLLPGGSPTPAVIKSFVRKHHKCKALLLDSLNDIHLPYPVSEYEDVSRAAMTAEEIAVEHDIPVINTVQIGRNTKGRAIKAPDLYDARGSGKVEEKAAVIIGLYHHWYHVAQKQIEEKFNNAGLSLDIGTYPKGTIQLSTLKLRDGEMGGRNNLIYRGGCGYYNE